jgi:galactokinase
MAAHTTTASAPGRVNLIGEHTDYNGGLVLPTAIPQRTQVELRPRPDALVAVRSQDVTPPEQAYHLGHEQRTHTWIDYVQGITACLAHAGLEHRGFEAAVTSTVPVGSGLSSSAALGVALLSALRDAFSLDLDDLHIARLTQQSENEFVGANVGIMDPMAAALGDEHSALLIDTRDLRFERIPLPWSPRAHAATQADLVVIHSGVSHDHAAGEYNARRADCEAAATELGAAYLCDLSLADLPRLASLPERLQKRARHVISENARVHDAVDALRRHDLERLGHLLSASHTSLRDDYQVSVPAVDLLVQLAQDDPRVFGARMTGGGFGGAVIAVASPGSGRDVAERLARAYGDQSGLTPAVVVPPPA